MQPLDSERVVVLSLREGDATAVGTLYSWYGDALYREVILPRVGNVELAENVLLDVFRKLMERRRELDPDADRSVYFWLRRVAINQALDVHRAQTRADRLESALEGELDDVVPQRDMPSARLSGLETSEAVLRTLEGINPRYAEALRLRLLEDRDRQECARMMEIPVANFDVVLFRACAAFRKEWERHEDRD